MFLLDFKLIFVFSECKIRKAKQEEFINDWNDNKNI